MYPMWHLLHMRMLRQHHKWSTSRQRQPCPTWRQLQPWSSTSRRRHPYPTWRQRQCSLHRRQQTRMPAVLAARTPAVAYAAPAPAVTYAPAVSTLSRFHDFVGGFSTAPVVPASTAFIGDIRFLSQHQPHLMHPSPNVTKHFQGALSQQGMSEGSGLSHMSV